MTAMGKSPVQDAVLECIKAGEVDNARIAAYVRSKIPGAETTVSSVASIKSRLRAEGSIEGAKLRSSGVDGFAAWDQRAAELSEPDTQETDEEVAARIKVRYAALEKNARRLVNGRMPALIVSGPPGLGKSYAIREELKKSDRQSWMDVAADLGGTLGDDDADTLKGKLYDTVSGSITGPGLYQALWNMRNGGVITLDDVDAVWRDEDCLNLLKAALDSDPEHRIISWRKEARWLEEHGIPRSFRFAGHVVFLTNIDFEAVIEKDGKQSEHFKALIDRSNYLCLTLRTPRDFMIRLRQVAILEGMLEKQHGLTAEQAEEIMEFIDQHKGEFYNLSLRLVGTCAETMKDDPEDWRDSIIATKTRTRGRRLAV